MKHFYFLFIGLVCCIGSNKSQINGYFNNNPCWTTQSMCQIDAQCYKVTNYNYIINGDTLIGSYQYKRVFTKGYGNNQYGAMGPPPLGNQCNSPSPFTQTLTLAFFLRSNNKKMYFHNLGLSSPDTLLYDFNLSVGSTLPLTYNNPSSSYTFTVTAIDSINTFNGWMRRFKLNNNSSFNFIEGMGYQNGLIELMPPNVMSCGWSLGCYSQNNTAYYPSSGPSCLLSTAIKENFLIDKPIVFPNPSQGKFQLRLTDFSINSKIEIYNVTGQLIQSFIPLSEKLEIDLGKEKDGIYFLTYISNGITKSVKLIKE